MEEADIVVIGAGWHGLAMAKTYLEVCPTARLLIFDIAASVGGVWAEERLYPGLKTNNLLGSYEFGDFPMTSAKFGAESGQHIPGAAVHKYLDSYAKHFNLMPHIYLRHEVESAKLLESGEWELWVNNLDGESLKGEGFSLTAKKIVVATGLTSSPSIPKFSRREYFNRPLFHSRDLKFQTDTLKNAKCVAVLGGNKSSWDTCYFAATNGSHVDMIIRPSGGGPSWLWPVAFSPLKLSVQRIAATRIFTWLDPCIWSQKKGISSWIRYLFHRTWIGRKIVSTFWNYIGSCASKINNFDASGETRKLKPWTSPFWMGNSLSIHNYSVPWLSLVQQGKVTVHIADVDTLSEGTVHLSDGTKIEVDALVCCTGWQVLPPVKFAPENLAKILGLQNLDIDDVDSINQARLHIFREFPALQGPPIRILPPGTIGPKHNLGLREKNLSARYRMYRFMIPSDENMLPLRNIAFIGAHLALCTAMIAQIQSLWITAYFLDELPHLKAANINYQDIKYQTILHNEHTRLRHPPEVGGAGERCPDLTFDCLPYMDLLMDDLGMNKYRKGTIWQEVFHRYLPNDYKGIVKDWIYAVQFRRKNERST